MKTLVCRWLLGAGVLIVAGTWLSAGDPPPYQRQQDVIYGRKYGSALTLDVFKPVGKANGAGIVWLISGGWISNHGDIHTAVPTILTKRGYTVFAVVHGSQPKYAIPEVLTHVNRAVRFIRAHAEQYGIDPQRLGSTGGSAGGHLALMLGTAGTNGSPKADDPVERVSSRVQAVACFFPPTDFLNWGSADRLAPPNLPERIRPAFDFTTQDPKTGGFVRITEPARVKEILRQISPLTHVSPQSAPTFILHGDKDTLVPLQQAEVFIAKLKEAHVDAALQIKRGAGHGWPDLPNDMAVMADWFDKHLAKK